jgi:propionyl-CoA synthetase
VDRLSGRQKSTKLFSRELRHQRVVQMVRQKIGPVPAFGTALVVPTMPKTRSGKILCGTIQNIADGQDFKMPATIDDSSALTEITQLLQRAGYANKPGAGSSPQVP